MRFTLGFSPCPNDTYIFDALVNRKIDTGDFEFDVHLEDVQTLNEGAIAGKSDFSKISYGVLPLVFDNYVLLNSGGALGRGVGPLLIVKPETSGEEIENGKIAIPGENTTAHLLFSMAYPNAKHKVFMPFNEIEDAVLNGAVNAGVIIHENRFTYESKGLRKLVDLGNFWEEKTEFPIPLGGIVARRNIDPEVIKKVDQLIKKSVEYAQQNYFFDLPDFIKNNAQEMDERVMWQHIRLYVNNFSVELEAEGREAVKKFLSVYNQLHPQSSVNEEEIFI